MFALLINGLNLKGTCFATDFVVDEDDYSITPFPERESKRVIEVEGITQLNSMFVANINNLEILQLETF